MAFVRRVIKRLTYLLTYLQISFGCHVVTVIVTVQKKEQTIPSKRTSIPFLVQVQHISSLSLCVNLIICNPRQNTLYGISATLPRLPMIAG